jgi:hypothetical protein
MPKLPPSTYMSDLLLATADGKVPCHKAIMANISEVIITSGNDGEFGVSGFSLQAVQILVNLIYGEKFSIDAPSSYTAEVLKLMQFLEIYDVSTYRLYKALSAQDIITILEDDTSKFVHRTFIEHAIACYQYGPINRNSALVFVCANPKVVFKHIRKETYKYINTKIYYRNPEFFRWYAQICKIMITLGVEYNDRAALALSAMYGLSIVANQSSNPQVEQRIEPPKCYRAGCDCPDCEQKRRYAPGAKIKNLDEICKWITNELKIHKENKKKSFFAICHLLFGIYYDVEKSTSICFLCSIQSLVLNSKFLDPIHVEV